MTNLMRRLGLVAAVLGLMMGTAGQARAWDLQIFDASGTFTYGYRTLSGTVTINTILGTATAADLSVSAPTSLNFTDIFRQGLEGPTYYIQVETSTPAFPSLTLGIPTSGSINPLIGYTGGQLFNDGSDIQFSPVGPYIDLTNGFLTPSVPEPSSALVAGIASLMGIGYAWRRCRRAKAGA